MNVKMIPNAIIISTFLVFSAGGCGLAETPDSQQLEQRTIQSDIFTSSPSDSLPTLFAPGFISTNLNERDAAISPDGKEFYFTLWSGAFGVIAFTREADQGWTSPEIAPFCGQYSDLEPFITHDGRRQYFASNRPLSGNGPPKDYAIWYVDRTANGWSQPVNLSAV